MSSNDPKTPKFIGFNPPKAASSYAESVKARAAANAAASRQNNALPNLANIDRVYDPNKDGPMTVAQLGKAQEQIVKASDDRAKLKPETAEQLRQIQEATRRQYEASMAAKEKVMQDPKPAAPTPPQPEPAVAETRRAAAAPINEESRRGILDDADFDQLMSQVRSDVINNAREREAVKSRVKEMDLGDGILTGIFMQDVPIKPGVLTVRFRTVSTYEIQEMRLLLLDMITRNELKGSIASDIFALMMACAAVVSINGSVLEPSFMRGSDPFAQEFDGALFEKRLNKFARYPTPLIHSLATHASWFDLRVREMFTTEAVKNG